MSFLAELKRRNVFRVALAYLVFAWLVLQVSDVLLPALQLPAWGITLVAVLLAIGFAFIVVFAWVYELTPEGIKRESDVDPDRSKTQQTGRRLNQLIALMLVVAVALLAVSVFDTDPAPVAGEAQSEKRRGPPVVAVLPFKAVGSDDGGFLAAGLHDDLLTRLAKLGSFRVISRTSMMEYANTTKNMRDIGLELGADYILEGGVQAIGDKVRISAQLIETSLDEHIWAETYNRKLTATDLFAVQSDIAQAISSEMQTSLTPDDIAQVDAVPTENTGAYRAYLEARQVRERLGFFSVEGVQEIIDNARRAVELDPDFAEAWALLSDSYSRRVRILGQEADRRAALDAFARARALQPGLVDVELAWVVYLYHGLDEFEQALHALEFLGARAAGDANAVALKAYLYRRLGHYQQGYEALQQAQRLDPNNENRGYQLVDIAIWAGHCDAARKHVDELSTTAIDHATALYALTIWQLECGGNYDGVLESLSGVDFTADWELWLARQAAIFADDHDYIVEFAMMDLPEANTLNAPNDLLHRAWALRYVGRPDEARRLLDEAGALLASMAIDVASPEYGTYARLQFAYASMRRDISGVHYWYAEMKKMKFPPDKFDHWSYALGLPFDAWNFVDAGLHDEAVALLREMFEGPGGHTWRFVDGLPPLDVLDDHPGFRELRAKYGN